MDNTLTWYKVVLIDILIASDEIDFPRWIQDEIYEKVLWESTTLPFPYLVQILCNAAKVPTIPKVDQGFKVIW